MESLNLQNQFLMAMPGLPDPFFAKSVSLIARHTPEGCLGFIINRPTNTSFADLMEHLGIDAFNPGLGETRILAGGPVQPEQGFVIHNSSSQSWENTLSISDQVSLTTSKDILEAIALEDGPEQFIICLGCASWQGGQVEDELLQNSWLNCPADTSLIFETPFERRWQDATGKLGIDVTLMTGTAGTA